MSSCAVAKLARNEAQDGSDRYFRENLDAGRRCVDFLLSAGVRHLVWRGILGRTWRRPRVAGADRSANSGRHDFHAASNCVRALVRAAHHRRSHGLRFDSDSPLVVAGLFCDLPPDRRVFQSPLHRRDARERVTHDPAVDAAVWRRRQIHVGSDRASRRARCSSEKMKARNLPGMQIVTGRSQLIFAPRARPNKAQPTPGHRVR
jgi:hypothetical protein